MIVNKLSDNDYFSIGGLTRDTFVSSASSYKDIYNRGLYDVLLQPFEPSEELQEALDQGTRLHSLILETNDFEKTYYLGDYDYYERRKHISEDEQEFLKGILEDIELKYPFFLEDKEDRNEIALIGNLDGIKAKSKLDRVVIDYSKREVNIFDLKSTFLKMGNVKKDKMGNAWEIKREINERHYDLQMYFYSEMVKQLLLDNMGDEAHYFTISPYLLFASKADYKARLVRLSDEIIGYGAEKFKTAHNEVKEWINGGELTPYLYI